MLGIAASTLHAWKLRHPEFKADLQAAKDDFDINNVEKALITRALGITVEETIEEPGPDGQMVVTRKVKKQLPPDAGAIRFYLACRNPARWRETKFLDGDVKMRISHEELLDRLDADLTASAALAGIDSEADAEDSSNLISL